ncbi:DNA/RNA nuclease SfsA [Tindallia californiensis]|uniref:Sugar fermentation stimulation protein homolog n=1 Tax=Tindallia californiensis TaxID=159292 RepID=A0A1H3MJL1_9FIRM|nr:DNA/RNA nuclease SfsA [Tindallia californiensis]SDY76917.1 sugar fermentation stimulation protein A [Tindallia californiensis]
MRYEKVVKGEFIKRPNRFIAHVLIDGREEVVHIKNTSRCRELLIPGVKVYLEDKREVPGRKTGYSVISVYKDDVLVNIDSQAPNTVIAEALENNKIDGFLNFSLLKREVTYGKSRFDIFMEREKEKIFIEVKGVTLENSGVSAFPDAPTERGVKHVKELEGAVAEGYRGVIFFLIKMQKPDLFKLNWKMDPAFAEAVCKAQSKGVEVLAYDSLVTPEEIFIGKKLPINLQPW